MLKPSQMHSSLRWAAIVGMATLVLGGACRPIAATAAQATDGCRHSNQVSANTKLGSQVDGDLVTICLSKSQLKLLKPKPKVIVTAKPKPTVVPIPVWRKPPAKTTATMKPVPKRPSVAKPKPTLQSSGKGNRGVFKPKVDTLVASPSQAQVGQPVSVSSFQLTRLGRTRLLGSPVTVKFQPVALDLDFGDSSSQSLASAQIAAIHRYQSPGRYWLTLHVRYRVLYRLSTGNWFRDPDSITLAAPQTVVQVATGSPESSRPKVVLVSPIG